MSDRQMVQIACTVPNGVDMRVAGMNGIVNLKGPSTGLRAGATNQNPGASPIVTEVDAKFWRRWKDANAKNPLLIAGAISEVTLPENPEQPGETIPSVEEYAGAGYNPANYRRFFDGKVLPSSDADIAAAEDRYNAAQTEQTRLNDEEAERQRIAAEDARKAAELQQGGGGGQGGTAELSDAELEALTDPDANPESSEAGDDDKDDGKPVT